MQYTCKSVYLLCDTFRYPVVLYELQKKNARKRNANVFKMFHDVLAKYI